MVKERPEIHRNDFSHIVTDDCKNMGEPFLHLGSVFFLVKLRTKRFLRLLFCFIILPVLFWTHASCMFNLGPKFSIRQHISDTKPPLFPETPRASQT
jgi:hypothetical protein